MFQTNIEFKKGILFIRISGILNKDNSYKLKSEIIPLLKNGFRYVVLNLNGVNLIDNYGIKTIDEISDAILKNNGKTTLIDNKTIENEINKTILKKVFYKVKNERVALGVFGL